MLCFLTINTEIHAMDIWAMQKLSVICINHATVALLLSLHCKVTTIGTRKPATTDNMAQRQKEMIPDGALEQPTTTINQLLDLFMYEKDNCFLV